MIKEVELLKCKIKDNIKSIIENGKLEEAIHLTEEYLKLDKSDIDIYSMLAVIYIMDNKLEDAENILNKGLKLEKNNFDLNYNLAYVYQLMEEREKACQYYKKAYKQSDNIEIKKIIENYISEVEGSIENIYSKQKRIAFLVKPGMDSFIDDIITELSKKYETKKIIVNQYSDIDYAMEYADICWFEWCDELIAYGSRHKSASKKKIICRLHSYEAFTEYIYNVEWKNVDDLIFVSESIKENVLSKIYIHPKNVHIIPNGINMDKYTFRNGSNGKNIAYIGYLNYKKGPMLLLHAFKAIYDHDNSYKLYIAGTFQDERYILYFEHMIKEMGLEKNVFYEGWQNNLDRWMEDKDYILCTSVLESQNMSVMQAMAKGIKPLVHNFVGAKEIYNDKYVWSTISDLVKKVTEEDYSSKEYRNFIEEKYTLDKQKQNIDNVLNNFKKKCENESEVKKVNQETQEYREYLPLVTVGVINYNNNKYIDDCIKSILDQKYNNIEILIVDDCSTDGSLEKIKKYEQENECIRAIYHSQNTGNGSYACKDIIREARGEYFTFIASDDYYPNNQVISNYMDQFDKDESIDYVYGNLINVNENKERIGEYIYKQFYNNEIIKEVYERMGSGILTMTGMFKKSFYIENGIEWVVPDDNKVAPDTLNSLIAVKNNIRTKYINKFILSYRQHTTNGTLNFEERVKSIRNVMDFIIDNFSEKIYAPQIKWDDMNEINKMCSKHFFNGGTYLKIASYYMDYWRPFGREVTIDREEKIKYIRPLLERANEYFEKSIEISDIYKNDIESMLKENRFDS